MSPSTRDLPRAEVAADGSLTLPASTCRRLGLGPGDRPSLRMHSDRLEIAGEPAPARPAAAFAPWLEISRRVREGR